MCKPRLGLVKTPQYYTKQTLILIQKTHIHFRHQKLRAVFVVCMYSGTSWITGVTLMAAVEGSQLGEQMDVEDQRKSNVRWVYTSHKLLNTVFLVTIWCRLPTCVIHVVLLQTKYCLNMRYERQSSWILWSTWNWNFTWYLLQNSVSKHWDCLRQVYL